MYRNFDLASLEKEYSPSSCVDDINVFINEYINLSKHAQHNAKQQNTYIANISYGSHKDEVIDLFIPTKRNNKKLHIYIHGGYWQELTKEESAFAANNFQQHGCYFAVINYSLAPHVTLTEIVEQNRKAIVHLVKNAEAFGFNPDEIYISGSSAGAHLAMLMLQTDWQTHELSNSFLKGVCLVSGIYDLTPIQYTYINDPLQLTQKEINNLSPSNLLSSHLYNEKCPIIIAIGQNETKEFKRQSVELFHQTEEHYEKSSFLEVPNKNHFNVIVELAYANTSLFNLISQQMGFEIHTI